MITCFIFLLQICCICLLASPLVAQDQFNPTVLISSNNGYINYISTPVQVADSDREKIFIHEKVGLEIDLDERNKYRLFARDPGFVSAVLVKLPDQDFEWRITCLDSSTGQKIAKARPTDESRIEQLRNYLSSFGERDRMEEKFEKNDVTRLSKSGLKTNSQPKASITFTLNAGYVNTYDSYLHSGYVIGVNLTHRPAKRIAYGVRIAYNRLKMNKEEARYLVGDVSCSGIVSGNGFSAIEIIPSLKLTSYKDEKIGFYLYAGLGLSLIKEDVFVTGYRRINFVDYLVQRDKRYKLIRPALQLGPAVMIENKIEILSIFSFTKGKEDYHLLLSINIGFNLRF
jgi:hypothetical protein